MSKVIHDLGDLLYEDGKLIYSANPSLCICCGDSEPGLCCVFGNDFSLCHQTSGTDTVGADGCTQCHSDSLPTSYPMGIERNTWYRSSVDYNMSNGNWHVEIKGCPFWYDPSTSRTYWPPIPSVTPTIVSSTAANAVLTSYTATHDCSTASDYRGCYADVYNCTSITLRWEGTSNVPTCTNCPTCTGYTSSDEWNFQAGNTPHTQMPPWTSSEPPCGNDPRAYPTWKFGITTDCEGDSDIIFGTSCQTCS